MDVQQTALAIREAMGFSPTADQDKAIDHLSALVNTSRPNALYLLKGYAGTGKTTLLGAFVNALSKLSVPFVLLAPTGRAAKVMSTYSGFRAHTIHRYIYRYMTGADGVTRIIPAPNKLSHAVFIIDEASMIGEDGGAGEGLLNRSLLTDLFSHVYRQNSNKLILVGDTAQLPPVGLDISPALDMSVLTATWPIVSYEHFLSVVMRQTNDSGILTAATRLRKKMAEENFTLPLFSLPPSTVDVEKITDGMAMEEELNRVYGGRSPEQGVVICRSNRRANLYNQQIRSRVYQRENELEGGDLLMVVKNNYFWLPEESPAGFLANGDIIEVRRVSGIEERYGFRFADVEIFMPDYPDEPTLEVKVLLDSLMADGPDIDRATYDRLFHAVEADLMDLPSRKARLEQIRKDPYYHAVHIKFGYALTCHKTQGGQWDVVFIEQPWLPDDTIDLNYLRWLYTAITRATQKVWLLGFTADHVDHADHRH